MKHWSSLQSEAEMLMADENCLARVLVNNILGHDSLESALSYRLARKLSCDEVGLQELGEICGDAYRRHLSLAAAAWADLDAVVARDPACKSRITPLLHFSGFLALQCHRVAHTLWHDRRRQTALHLQSRSSQIFGVDIHPAARIGRGVLIDHAISVVIGETAVVEDEVSMLHEVTLGGRGDSSGDRHPKIRRGVSLGAGAKILGNIEVGQYARVGAGSVVLEDVPPFCTVAGVPAKVVCPPRNREIYSAAPEKSVRQ